MHRVFLVLLLQFGLAAELSQAQVTEDNAKLSLVAEDFKFTEGPAVDKDGNLFFTDQPNDRIMRLATDGTMDTWLQPAGRSNGLFFDKEGNLIACADEKNELWKVLPDKSHKVLVNEFEGKRFNGPNDVWVGQNGDIYFTDPLYRRPYWERDPAAQLPRQVYRLKSGSESVEVAADSFKQPNGIVGDPRAKKLYVADIDDKKTYRYSINDDGSLSERELFCEMGSDGMAVDRDGNVYLTNKAGVTVFDSQGKKLQVISVPEGWIANVCFGGADRKTLYITAMDSLYQIQMKVAGY